jgi:hypothetical protein
MRLRKAVMCEYILTGLDQRIARQRLHKHATMEAVCQWTNVTARC